ncbi:hypothetical protein [Pseudodesulfovibrio sediminis]|nr:hypothetical protein [Pseudodesulfovibrio sediminis]
MRKNIFLLVLLLMLLSAFGCNAKKPTVYMDIPIKPVTTPTLYSYGPSSGTYLYTIKTAEKISSKIMNIDMEMQYTVTRKADLISWNIDIPKIKVDAVEVRPEKLIAHATLITNTHGEMQKDAYLSSPWLESLPDYNEEQKEKIDQLASRLADMIAQLSLKPIVSGQSLWEKSLNTMKDIQNIEGVTIREDQMVKNTLQGEFMTNGIQYVASTIDEDFTFSVEDLPVTMTISGKSIYQKTNMELVDMTMEINGSTPGIKNFVTVTARWQKQ